MFAKLLKKMFSNGLRSLNVTQITGAFNDNFFQGIMIYFLIRTKGIIFASTITSICYGVMFLPCIMFLSCAGLLADRFRKRNILVTFKAVELVIMSLGCLAIYLKSELFCYLLLFLMGSQTAFFCPSKYGIIPELVDKDNLTKANVTITIFTSIAILFGELTASFCTHILHENFYFISLLPIAVSFFGLVAAKNIPQTESYGVKEKINPIFFIDMYRNLKLMLRTPFLLHTTIAGSMFWFAGAYIKMNLIPFLAQEHLQLFNIELDDVSKGYVYVFMTIGGALGAKLVARYNLKGLGVSLCIAFIFPILFFIIPFCSALFLVATIFAFGMALTMYYVPIEVFLQESVTEEERGRIIACYHLTTFIFMMLASALLYFFNSFLMFSAASSFVFIGVILLVINIGLCSTLSSFVFPCFAKCILQRIYNIVLDNKLPRAGSYIMLSKRSIIDFFFFFSFFSKGKAVVLLSSKKWARLSNFLSRYIPSVTFLRDEKDIVTKIMEAANAIRSDDEPVLISASKAVQDKFFRSCGNEHIYLMHSVYKPKGCFWKLKTISYHFEYLLDSFGTK